MKLWDTATRQEVATLSGLSGPSGVYAPVESIAFSPDGRTLNRRVEIRDLTCSVKVGEVEQEGSL